MMKMFVLLAAIALSAETTYKSDLPVVNGITNCVEVKVDTAASGCSNAADQLTSYTEGECTPNACPKLQSGSQWKDIEDGIIAMLSGCSSAKVEWHSNADGCNS